MEGFGNRRLRRALASALAFALLLSGCAFGAAPRASARDFFSHAAEALAARGGYALRAAVIYDSSAPGTSWKSVYEALDQPLTLNLSVTAADSSAGLPELDADFLYLDGSLAGALSAEDAAKIADYVSAGGAAFVDNALYDAFPPEFFGVRSFTKIDDYPETVKLPKVDADYSDLQEIIGDYHGLFSRFGDFEILKGRDYGYAAVVRGGTALASCDVGALYVLNQYGDGLVFLTNPLLPTFSIAAAFDLESGDGDAAVFAPTAATANQIILSEFASLVAKRVYGFALERVFGSYGSPDMAWELHYEEINAMGNYSLLTFSALCEESLQIPSYTLVRNPYNWFVQSETMSYLLNGGGSAGKLSFTMDLYENAYSSGTHIDSGGKWLELASLGDAASYFDRAPQENYRLFPCAFDLSGDGRPDFLAGSADGKVYYYENLGFTGLDGRLRFAEPVGLEGVSADSFSAPAMMDVDRDGAPDLVVGGGDGSLVWYRGLGDLRFRAMGALIETGLAGQVLPAAADADGDGVPDLLLGSDAGALALYSGTYSGGKWAAKTRTDLSGLLGDNFDFGWVSASWADADGDGGLDIIAGNFDGYVRVFRADGRGGYADAGAVTMPERNYQGNNNVKFGTYVTPLLLDLDGDGDLDLICGYLEYGLAYPVDSVYFPYRDALREQIDYCRERNYYFSAHSMTTAYSDTAREAYEIGAQIAALQSYGVDVTGLGTNQHTWFLSSFSPRQTFREQYAAGYLWNSGCSPAGSTLRYPQSQAENVIAYPFYMVDGEEEAKTLFLQNVSVLPYFGTEDTDLSGKYGMPVSAYYHCDLIFRYGEEMYVNAIRTLADFQRKFDYNFVREDQLVYACAAAYALSVDVTAAEDGALSIAPRTTGGELVRTGYASACGVRLEPAARYHAAALTSDAPVFKREEDCLLLGLSEPVLLRAAGGDFAESRVRRVNLPAEITQADGGATLRFLDGGMMQAAVSGDAFTRDEGWTVTQNESGTVFTKFGGAETLHIIYTE